MSALLTLIAILESRKVSAIVRKANFARAESLYLESADAGEMHINMRVSSDKESRFAVLGDSGVETLPYTSVANQTPLIAVQYMLFSRESLQGFNDAESVSSVIKTTMPKVFAAQSAKHGLQLFTAEKSAYAYLYDGNLPKLYTKHGLTVSDLIAELTPRVTAFMNRWANNNTPINSVKDARNALAYAHNIQ